MAATTAAAAAPPKEGEGGGEDREEEEEEEEEKPEVETEDEKMARIRAVQFPIIEEYQKILQTVFPLFIRKGAKKKTELPEKEVATMVRALGFNPTHEQVEKLAANARYKELHTTTKLHFAYDNFEQREFEYLFFETSAFKRHPKEKILEALLKLAKGQKEMDAEELKKIMRTRGIPFTEEEAVKMLRVARDRDTGKVYVEEYAKLLTQDGQPPPPDPLEPLDERFR